MPSEHLRRDAAQLSHNRTLEEIVRISDTFGAEHLPIVAFAAMKAGFTALHAALSTVNPEFTREAVLESWVKTMLEETKNERA